MVRQVNVGLAVFQVDQENRVNKVKLEHLVNLELQEDRDILVIKEVLGKMGDQVLKVLQVTPVHRETQVFKV